MKIKMVLLCVICLINHTRSQTMAWAKSVGSNVISAAADPSGNIYTTGNFQGVVDFDPGSGSYTLGIISTINSNLFISKSDVAGNFISAAAINVVSGQGYAVPYCIKADNSGNVYVIGAFLTTAGSMIDFDPGPGTFTMATLGTQPLGFILKLNASGNFVWAKSLEGSSGSCTGTSIIPDALGNLYAAGYFRGTIDFDPGTGSYPLSTPGNTVAAFTMKLDAFGNFAWANFISGSGPIITNSIDLDAAGNIYMAGSYEATGDFDPGGLSFLMTSAGAADIFALKLTSSGNFVWAKSMGGTDANGATCIAVDPAGNSHLTGASGGTADYDPGVGTYILTSSAPTDIFVLKLDVGGNFLWVKTTGNSSSASYLKNTGLSIDVDFLGNVFTGGAFSGSVAVDFDPGPGTYTILSAPSASWSSFISELDAAGNFIWAGTMGGGEARSVVVNNNDIYVAGYYINSSDIDPTAGTYSLSGFNDGFVLKLGLQSISSPIHGPFVLCSSNTVAATYSITGNSGNTYTWSVAGTATLNSAVNSESVNITFGSGSGTITVSISDFSTTVTNSIVVNAGSNPVLGITASPALTVCPGATVNLSGSGAQSYAWNGGVNDNLPFTLNSPGIYTLTGLSAIGCIETKTIALSTYSAPLVGGVALPSSTLCYGSPLTLSGTGAPTYTWNNGIINNSTFTVSSSSVYSVSSTGGNGCVGRATVSVVVVPLPVLGVSILGTSPVCSGTTQVALNGTGASTYTWSNGLPNGTYFVATSTQVYTLTATGNGCINTATIPLIVTQTPTLSLVSVPPPTVCIGSSLTLNATGALLYYWLGGGVVSNNVPFTATATTIYTVVGITNGCVHVLTVSVVASAVPPVAIQTLPSTSVCVGGTVALFNTTSIYYSWSSGVIDGVPIVINAPATYTLTGYNLGCINTATVAITVNPLPSVGFQALPSLTVCAGSSLVLNGTGASSYNWTGGVNNNAPFNAAASQAYTVTGTDSNGCKNTATLQTNVNPKPALNVVALPSATVCIGASITVQGAGASTYSWSGNVSNNVPFTLTANGNYTVTGTDLNGCVNTATVSLNATPLPVLGFTAVPSLTICDGSGLNITASGASTYTWSNGINNGAFFTPANSSSYAVTGADANGCVNMIQLNVVVNPRPVISLQPFSQSLSIGSATQYVVASVNPGAGYQWQQSSGGAFTNITNTSQYAGINTASLIVFNVDLSQNNLSFRCIISLGNCSDTSDIASLSVFDVTGIKQYKHERLLSLSPNPANTSCKMYVTDFSQVENYSIADQTGRLVLTGEVTNSETEIDLTVLVPGLYFVSLSGFSQKPIKLIKSDF